MVQTQTDNGFLMQFMMPTVYTLAALPKPLNSQVTLRAEPAKTVVAHRYSGSWSQRNYDKHLTVLKTALADAGIKTQGELLYSRYNLPFTPWFMRRNEIWFNVQQ